MATPSTTETFQQRLAGIAGDPYFWGRVPKEMRAVLEDSCGDRAQLTLDRLESNFQLDRQRIDAFVRYKDAIPSLGSPEPAWLNKLRCSVWPDSTARYRAGVLSAMQNLEIAYSKYLDHLEAEQLANQMTEGRRVQFVAANATLLRLAHAHHSYWVRTVSTPIAPDAAKALRDKVETAMDQATFYRHLVLSRDPHVRSTTNRNSALNAA